MKPFYTVAVPHKDILEGRLNLDVYAADLWEVFKGRSIPEYQDEGEFFNKTYMTEGLDSLIKKIEAQLTKNTGVPVIQLQTPFGGGKTHTLIALYHLARKQNINVVVIVGEKLNTSSDPLKCETLWGVIEEQLTGKKGEFSSMVISPGGEQIRSLLEKHKPLLILIDELIPYLNNISGVKINSETTLASQTLSFLHILTNVISSLPNTVLVATTTPSNPYDKGESGERLVKDLEAIFSRRELIETPVKDSEIALVISKRLFSKIDEKYRDKIVNKVADYFEEQKILPNGMFKNEYKKLFKDSYPFLPDVIDTLYHKWGSFPTFQRTRGVLRLLALVVNSLKDRNIPYISLSDFDLSNQYLRQEFIKHLDSVFNSVIDSDITGNNSGSKRVDKLLGDAYSGYNIATRAATCIFLSSFSTGVEKGITLKDIKRNASYIDFLSQVVSDAVEQMKTKLSYLQTTNDKYYFTSQVNLWGLLINLMDNIPSKEIDKEREELVKNKISSSCFKVYHFPSNTSDIIDNEQLKLIILKSYDKNFITDIITNKGVTKRVYRNTLLFLVPKEDEIHSLDYSIKLELAINHIRKDKSIKLSNEQSKQLDEKEKENKSHKEESLRRYYRLLIVPKADGLKEIDLGIPTANEKINYEKEIIENLKSEGEFLSKIDPVVIKEKYLSELSNETGYVSTKQIYESSLKTPGETRFEGKWVLGEAIKEGVKRGLFGFGIKENGNIKCLGFKDDLVNPTFDDNEVIIKEELAKKLIEESQEGIKEGWQPPVGPKPQDLDDRTQQPPPSPSQPKHEKSLDYLKLSFEIPKGKSSEIFKMVNLLQSRFDKVKLMIECDKGSILENDYETKVKETFSQLGIKLDIEKTGRDLFDDKNLEH